MLHGKIFQINSCLSLRFESVTCPDSLGFRGITRGLRLGKIRPHGRERPKLVGKQLIDISLFFTKNIAASALVRFTESRAAIGILPRCNAGSPAV